MTLGSYLGHSQCSNTLSKSQIANELRGAVKKKIDTI